MRRTAAHTLVLLALAALWGCDEGAQAQDDARASQESAELASDDGSLTLAEAGLLLGSVPLGGAAPAEGSWSPPGCASSSTVEGDTALEATTTWTLSGCTGPYGVGSVDGTLVVETSSAEGGVVTAQVTSQGLTLNRIELSLSASVTYDPGLRGDALQVESQSTGVGPFGHAVQREASYTAAWNADKTCVTVDGAGSTTVGGASWEIAVEAVSQCEGGCPQAGGAITYASSRGTSVVVQFEGDSSATWTATTERQESSGALALTCGP